jgi:hypothetical protein
VFVEEHSIRALTVHLAKSWCKYHPSDVAGKMYGPMSLVTNGTLPHADGKAMLVAAFDSCMWIIGIPQMGVSCVVGSIAGKMCLVGKKKTDKLYELYWG